MQAVFCLYWNTRLICTHTTEVMESYSCMDIIVAMEVSCGCRLVVEKMK